MTIRYIFNTEGEYVGFVQGSNLFSPQSAWLGFIRPPNEVYGALDGRFMGYLMQDDRVVRKKSDSSRLPQPRPLPPLPPLRPLRPLKRLQMSRLPLGHLDVFENIKPSASSGSDPELDNLEGTTLQVKGVMLGKVTRNRFDTAGLSNSFGNYGSRYSSTSIFNQYSQYGGPYGPYSPFNPYSAEPPVFVRNGREISYLTANVYLKPRVDPQRFIAWLGVEP